MPKASRGTATQRLAEGPVESFSEDLEGGYTVNFVRFMPDMDQTPLLKGLLAGRVACAPTGLALADVDVGLAALACLPSPLQPPARTTTGASAPTSRLKRRLALYPTR